MSSLPPAVSGGRPVLGNTLEFMRDPVAVLERGHREHGRMFTVRLVGRRAVVLLGPEHNRFFFAETDQRLSMRDGMPYFPRMFDPDFYVFGSPDEYRRQRQIVLPGFQGRQMDDYVAVMEQQTRVLADELGERGTIDLVAALGPLVMRIAAYAFLGPDFGRRMGLEFFEEFRRFSAGMDPVAPTWLPLPHLVRSRRARNRLRVALGRLIEQRRREPADPPDFLQLLAEARYEDGTRVPDLVLINLVLMLTWAGHETTTGHVSWALIDLLQHPEELDKVLDEQRRILAGTDRLTRHSLHQLAHLDRALHETERLHPVAHILARGATEAIPYQGYLIPAKTLVLLAPSVSHRLPDVYPEPDRYHPDRFVADPRGMRDLIGFGGGVHRCLGVHFAYLEMMVVVTTLLRQFEFELVDRDPQPIPGQKTKWPQSPCRVHYHRRVRVPA